jgi:hypothetical protein
MPKLLFIRMKFNSNDPNVALRKFKNLEKEKKETILCESNEYKKYNKIYYFCNGFEGVH